MNQSIEHSVIVSGICSAPSLGWAHGGMAPAKIARAPAKIKPAVSESVQKGDLLNFGFLAQPHEMCAGCHERPRWQQWH